MLVRTRPMTMADPFSRMTRDLDRLFESLNGNGMRPYVGDDAEARFAPPMNVWEDENAFHVEAELPGIPMDNIDVLATNDSLTIKGERTEVNREDAAAHITERRFGSFERSLTLNGEIDVDNVQASLNDGVLHVTLPKADNGRRSRKVQISSGNGEHTTPETS